MKIWIDDIRSAPDGYVWIKTVDDAKFYCYLAYHESKLGIEEINLDHDAGKMNIYGGDYIKFLNWLEEKAYIYKWNIQTIFKFHSMNPVGAENMKRICKHNGWRVE